MSLNAKDTEPSSPPTSQGTAGSHARSGLIGWFASNPVAANLLMALIVVGGLESFQHIRKEVMPRFDPHQVEVRAFYPAAGPEEVERAVCMPIETAIHALPGIKRLDAEASEGECRLTLKLAPDHEIGELIATARARIQEIKNLPKDVEKIQIEPAHEDIEAINVMLHGRTDPLTLRRYGQRIREELAHLPGVARLFDYNEAFTYEMTIQVSEEKLRRYRLSFADVTEAIRRESLDLTGGSLRTAAGELLVRARGRAEQAPDFASLTIRTDADGSRLTLGDIAEIRDGLIEAPYENLFDGDPTEGWEVFAEHDAVDVARRVKDYVAQARTELPEGLHLSTWWDNSLMFEERLKTLLDDGVAGFILVFLVLMLFLRTQVAFWAGMGILTSLLGAVWLMPALGLTLNLFSLFGFLLAMGILVDDAIIVGERVHTFQTQGVPPLEGAIRGTREVALPVTLAVMTTMVAFLPGLSLPGWAGRMTYPICMVMILTVLFSLVEALLILPSHLATPLAAPGTRRGWIEPIRTRLNAGLERFVQKVYRPFLDGALRWRYLTVSIFVAALLLVGALPYSGLVRVSLEADVTRDYFRVELLLPPGAPPAERRAFAERVQNALYSLRDELDREQPPGTPSVVAHLETLILERPTYLYVEFSPEARERYDIDALVQSWRERIGDIGNARIAFLYRQGETPYDIVLELSADDGDAVNSAASELKRTLVGYPGVYDVSDSYEPGKPELRLRLKPEAIRLGLRLRDVAEQVHGGFYGEEVQRFQRDGEEVKVVVRLPLAQRSNLDHLLSLPIRLPSGSSAPLGSLAEVSFAPGYATLIRQDRRRLVEVRARVDSRAADVNAIYADLEKNALQRLQREHPGLRTNVGQQRLEQEAMASTLVRNTAIALIVIYGLIAVPFRSYFKPLIFLLAAPVAWGGAVFAHWLIGLSLSMESLVGMIAASGVVVNDSLVLLDYINERGDTGEPVADLIRQACTSRFRPILLAFLTNFAGFLPTLMETSAQAQFLIPMTISLSAGLLFGMAASLILTPACYAILGKT